MKCSLCEETGKKFFIVIGQSVICEDCSKTKEKPKVITGAPSPPPIFNKWHCRTHKCGSYNVQNLSRHEMDDCDIYWEQTEGIVRPKTYGGYNGNVGRQYFRRSIDIERDFMNAWKKTVDQLRHSRQVRIYTETEIVIYDHGNVIRKRRWRHATKKRSGSPRTGPQSH